MKYSRSRFLVFAICFFMSLSACSEDLTKSMAFENSILEYTKFAGGKMKLSDPELLDLGIDALNDLVIRDSLLIFSTRDPQGYWHFYRLDNLSFLGKYLKQGRTNSEVLSTPWVSHQYFYEKDGELFSNIYEFDTGMIDEFNITKTLESKHTVLKQKDVGLPRTLFNVVQLDSESYFCRKVDNTHTCQDRYIYRNGEIKCPKYLAQLNESKVKRGEDINNIGAFYAYNPEKKVLAEVPIYLRHINVYSLDNGPLHSTLRYGKRLDNLDRIGSVPYAKKIQAYDHLASYPDFFVALYQGDTLENIEYGKSANQSLHFISWNGIPIMEVEIDRRITSFDIDFEGGFIYTVNYDSDEVYRYDAKEVLHELCH